MWRSKQADCVKGQRFLCQISIPPVVFVTYARGVKLQKEAKVGSTWRGCCVPSYVHAFDATWSNQPFDNSWNAEHDDYDEWLHGIEYDTDEFSCRFSLAVD